MSDISRLIHGENLVAFHTKVRLTSSPDWPMRLKFGTFTVAFVMHAITLANFFVW